MRYWQQFVDTVDSDGGHIIILLALIIIGVHTDSMELRLAAQGALLMKLKDAGSNQRRANEATTVKSQ